MLKKETIDLIIKNYKNKTYLELSNELNISVRTISYILRRLNIKKINEPVNWDDTKLNFLKENYYKGSKFCSEKLGIKSNLILKKASELKLKRGFKTNELLLDLTNKYSIYLLGYLWSDGYILLNNHNKICQIEIDKNDYFDIKYIFDMFGDWNIKDMSKYKKKKHHKDLYRIKTTNPLIYDFLYLHDYKYKKSLSPEKLLFKIPFEKQHYFWRGVLDGDGCIKFNKNKYYSLVFSSSIDYNWSSLICYCNKLNISHNIYNLKSKSGKVSLFCIQKKKDMYNFLNNIYYDNFGLSRKYKKYLLFNQFYNNPS